MNPNGLAEARCDPERGCITCSDEGAEMHVVDAAAEEGLAVCTDAAGRRTEVMTGLVGPVVVGDRLLVHAGTALIRLDATAEDAA